MASETRKALEDLNLTNEEVERLTEAFKKEEFRKLFKEYADEISDPENRRRYEEEIKILESERGMDVKFVNPNPGYVVKTTANGDRKAFINICTNDNIEKPSSKQQTGPDGKRGLVWTIPHSFSPPRDDVDKNGNKCKVFDFVIHPDTYRMAETNNRFRAMIQETAFDGIERQFDVKLDRKNLRFPKMKFKGTPTATVIRTKSKEKPKERDPDDILNSIPYPYDDLTSEEKAKRNEEIAKQREAKKKEQEEKVKENKVKNEDDEFAVPKYSIKHRSEIDLQDYRNVRDAKTSTRPNELVVEIDLPLLKSAAPVELDIFEKSLSMKSTSPAKYKLQLDLPYPVDENHGSAKFDKSKRKLCITLPVLPIKEHVNVLFQATPSEDNIQENTESDFPEPNASTNEKPLIEVLSSKDAPETADTDEPPPLEDVSDEETNDSKPLNELLESKETAKEPTVNSIASESNGPQSPPSVPVSNSHVSYMMPSFDYHQDDETVSIILHAGKVERSTVKLSYPSSNAFQIRMSSIGSGGFPIDYGFYARFPESCTIEVENCRADVDIHNVVVILVKTDTAIGPWDKFEAGLNEDNLEEKLFLTKKNLLKQLSDLRPEHGNTNEDGTISPELDVTEMDSEKLVISFKNQSRKKRKKHLSESADDIKVVHQHRVPPLKGIIKRRSISESSDDVYSYTRQSSTTSFNGSESSLIDSDENWDGSSRKKSVSFCEHVDQTVYKSNQSVTSMKMMLKNRRKNQRKRERKQMEKEQRRRRKSSGSEGASSDETPPGDSPASGLNEKSNNVTNLSSSPDYDGEGDDEGSPTTAATSKQDMWPDVKVEERTICAHGTKTEQQDPTFIEDASKDGMLNPNDSNVASSGQMEEAVSSSGDLPVPLIPVDKKSDSSDSSKHDSPPTADVVGNQSSTSVFSSSKEQEKLTEDCIPSIPTEDTSKSEAVVTSKTGSKEKSTLDEDIDSDDDGTRESADDRKISLIEELDPQKTSRGSTVNGTIEGQVKTSADTMLSWKDGTRSAEHSTKCAFDFDNSVVFDLDTD